MCLQEAHINSGYVDFVALCRHILNYNLIHRRPGGFIETVRLAITTIAVAIIAVTAVTATIIANAEFRYCNSSLTVDSCSFAGLRSGLGFRNPRLAPSVRRAVCPVAVSNLGCPIIRLRCHPIIEQRAKTSPTASH